MVSFSGQKPKHIHLDFYHYIAASQARLFRCVIELLYHSIINVYVYFKLTQHITLLINLKHFISNIKITHINSKLYVGDFSFDRFNLLRQLSAFSHSILINMMMVFHWQKVIS